MTSGIVTQHLQQPPQAHKHPSTVERYDAPAPTFKNCRKNIVANGIVAGLKLKFGMFEHLQSIDNLKELRKL